MTTEKSSSRSDAQGNAEPMRFEINRLTSYDDASLIAELQRAAALVPPGPMTAAAYDQAGRAHSTTIKRRFGGWQQALERAGLGDRYAGRPVTERMRDQRGKSATAEEIIVELQRISRVVGRDTLTLDDLRAEGTLVSSRAVISRFGSWKAALVAAGLDVTRLGRRYTEDEYFENLLVVWTHHGRAPSYAGMDKPPSTISSGGYAKRFGTWAKAKEAFVARVNYELETEREQSCATMPRSPTQPAVRQENQRWIPVGLRYQVLGRDRFRCVICGRSPATDLGCVLHVDHVLAFARGGKTRMENLRSFCSDCNLGKSDRIE